jgi:probable rRNA maturation factor
MSVTNLTTTMTDLGHDVAVIWSLPELRMAGDPDDSEFAQWGVQTLLDRGAASCELAVKIVDEDESQALNELYRNKYAPTNVLSFPLDGGLPDRRLLLGDLAICAEVVRREAASQNKTVQAHFAHMVVHGVMHLLGFDHVETAEAEEMEQIETEILRTMGFPNPYE